MAVLDSLHDGDLLVMGSRGRGAVRAGLFGSTVYNVLDHSAVPVVVVEASRTANPPRSVGEPDRTAFPRTRSGGQPGPAGGGGTGRPVPERRRSPRQRSASRDLLGSDAPAPTREVRGRAGEHLVMGHLLLATHRRCEVSARPGAKEVLLLPRGDVDPRTVMSRHSPPVPARTIRRPDSRSILMASQWSLAPGAQGSTEWSRSRACRGSRAVVTSWPCPWTSTLQPLR